MGSYQIKAIVLYVGLNSHQDSNHSQTMIGVVNEYSGQLIIISNRWLCCY